MTSYKILPSTRNLFKSTMLIIAIQSILWLLFVNKSFAFDIDHNISQDILKNNFRGSMRKLVDTSQKVECTYPDNNNICVCPGPCMEHIKNSTNCGLKHCFKWNKELKRCEGSGKDHTTPLILSAIPISSQLGIGYGIIGRWDLFGMQLGITFGPCIIICILSCILLLKNNENETDVDNTIELYGCLSYCTGCIWSIAILIFYILAIIWMATPNEILDSTGCPLTGFK